MARRIITVPPRGDDDDDDVRSERGRDEPRPRPQMPEEREGRQHVPMPEPQVEQKKREPKQYKISVAPPLSEQLPVEVLIGPIDFIVAKGSRGGAGAGIVHLSNYPTTHQLFRRVHPSPMDGWLCRAQKEKGLPSEQQSSVVLSHYAMEIRKPLSFYIGQRILMTSIGYGHGLKLPGRWPARWVSSYCVGWLLYNVVNAPPPLRRLIPMVGTENDYYRLKKVVNQPPGQCEFGRRDDDMSIDQAEATLGYGVKWTNSLDKLWTAYRASRAEWDIRNAEADEAEQYESMLQQIESAFITIMVKRFMFPAYTISSYHYPMPHHMMDRIIAMSDVKFAERARRHLDKLIRAGEKTRENYDAELKSIMRAMKQELLQRRRIGPEFSSVPERVLTQLFGLSLAA